MTVRVETLRVLMTAVAFLASLGSVVAASVTRGMHDPALSSAPSPTFFWCLGAVVFLGLAFRAWRA